MGALIGLWFYSNYVLDYFMVRSTDFYLLMYFSRQMLHGVIKSGANVYLRLYVLDIVSNAHAVLATTCSHMRFNANSL